MKRGMVGETPKRRNAKTPKRLMPVNAHEILPMHHGAAIGQSVYRSISVFGEKPFVLRGLYRVRASREWNHG
jgi:hypothetical protein